ncbi:MAG: hypothetical protein JJE39_01675 [Vicinamibacteria bacterium]|nr:hypothetical protein [Vicinamibacteria bacterium]
MITPTRVEQENRLARQGRVRRDRLNSESAAGEIQKLRARVGEALVSACRASSDPAALRQRTVASTAGLALSPFSLSVTGGPAGGALVEAEGTKGVVAELLRRLGEPGRGGFLRSAFLRNNRGRWIVSASAGALDTLPPSLMATPAPCPAPPDPGPPETVPRAADRPSGPRPAQARRLPATGAPFVPSAPEFAPDKAPPFTLIAFLTADGRNRVSVAAGGEVRVVSVGDQVEGWTCVSIDRDLGAVFKSGSLEQFVLKAGR